MGTDLLSKALSQNYFLPVTSPGVENLQQTAAGDGPVQGATSCVTTNHTQLLSGNIVQSVCMVMSVERESGLGSGIGAISLENNKPITGRRGEEYGQKRSNRGWIRTEEKLLSIYDTWLRMDNVWDPSSALYERHLLQAEQLGRVGERQDTELDAEWETGEWSRKREGRKREEVWLSVRAVTRRGKCCCG